MVRGGTMATESAPDGRSTRPWRRGVVGVIVLAALFGALFVARMLLAPWAFPMPGQPRLTGYWQGEIAYSKTDSRQVLLRLGYDENCSLACDMTGDIKICGAGKDRSDDLSGDVHNRRGTRFSLAPHLPRSKGDVNVEKLDGTWDGDRLRMRAKVALLDGEGVWHSDQQPPSPPEFAMHRTTQAAFEAACASDGAS
jgi:hypothetical protein